MTHSSTQARRGFLMAWQRFLRLSLALLVMPWIMGSEAAGRSSSAKSAPNVVFLFADDLGYADLGCYGNTKIKTPNLDRLAADGLKFTSFYSCSPFCTPSRAGLLTGRYPIRSGLTDVLFPNSKRGISNSEITLAEALKKRGYATACVGKWHLGDQPSHLPTRHGFDHYFGIPYSNDMAPLILLRDEKTIEEKTDLSALTRRYTEEAIRFLGDAKDRPFFLYLPYTMPHVPLAVSERFKGKSAGGRYGDVIEELDDSVGQILAALKRLKREENTLVVFSSDNGAPGHGRNGKLRHGKGTTFEGGIRMPCLARWPGRIRAGRVETRPAIMLDWFPTLVQLAGGKLPDDRIVDGRDLRGVLRGTGKRADEEFYFYLGKQLQAHRSGDWKLKRPFKGKVNYGKHEEHSWLLFNVDHDPSESNDLADKHADIVQRLRQQMDDFEKQVKTRP